MKIKNIPRQVVLLGLISFFTDFASEMLYPVTPIFLTSILGASMAAVGLIEGLAEVTAGFLKGYFGALSDKLGKRSIFVLLGYSLSGLVKPLPGLFQNVWTVVFSRTADRVGKGIRTAPRDALLASYSNNNSGAIFGFHRAMDTFGAVVGPLTAILLLYFYPGRYAMIFLISFIPSVFAIVISAIVKDRKPETVKEKKKLFAGFWRQAPSQYKTFLIIFTLFSFVNSSDVFLILRSKQILRSDTFAILSYVLYNIVYAFSSYPIGMLADRAGKKKIFIIGMFIFSLVYLGFALDTNLAITIVLFILYGVYAASTEGVAKAWVSDLVEENFRGSAIGMLTMLSSFGVMAGSVFTGILWDAFGAAVPFAISSAASFIIAWILILMKKNG